MIEELFDSISDGISDMFANEIEVPNTLDVLYSASENAMDSFLNGDFSSSNVDFSSLFEDTSNLVRISLSGYRHFTFVVPCVSL